MVSGLCLAVTNFPLNVFIPPNPIILYSLYKSRWHCYISIPVKVLQNQPSQGFHAGIATVVRILFSCCQNRKRWLLLFCNPFLSNRSSIHSFLLSLGLLMMASINFMAVKLLIFLITIAIPLLSVVEQMIGNWFYINTQP